jgi:hypothetical protein
MDFDTFIAYVFVAFAISTIVVCMFRCLLAIFPWSDDDEAVITKRYYE